MNKKAKYCTTLNVFTSLESQEDVKISGSSFNGHKAKFPGEIALLPWKRMRIKALIYGHLRKS